MRALNGMHTVLTLAISTGLAGVHSSPAPTPPPPAVDCRHAVGDDYVVLVKNGSRDRATVLVDGMRPSGECVNDMAVMSSSLMNVGSFVAPNGRCQSAWMVVYGPHQAMQWLDASGCWSNDGDRVFVSMDQPLLQVPIRVWSVGTVPADENVLHSAQVEVQRANQLFSAAGGGFKLDAPTAVTPAKATVANCADLKKADRDPKALNIYYAYNSYSGEAGDARGFACPGDAQMIVRNATADPETLAHEVGHALSLTHFTDDSSNVMTAGGVGRDNMTTGQAFRANVQPASLLNDPLRIRNGPTETECHEFFGGLCPSARCTGCPNVPPLQPLQAHMRVASIAAAQTAVQVDAKIAQWLTCEECVAGELDTIRGDASTTEQFIVLVSGSLSEESRRFLETRLRESYQALRIYEADPRNAKVPDNEQNYVNRYLANARALQQIRAGLALAALRPTMSDAQRSRARQAIQTTLTSTARTDVKRALASAIDAM